MIKIHELDLLLIEAGIEAEKRNDIIAQAQKLEEEKKEERASNKAPKSKYKYTIVVRGDKSLADVLADGWIVKTPLEQDDNELVSRIRLATGRQNGAQKRKKNFLKTFADFFAFSKRKFTKESDVSVQPITKEPVRVVILETSNIDGTKDIF